MKTTTDFYGSKIKQGLLHKKMGVKTGGKIPAKAEHSALSDLKADKSKSKAQVTKERELQFAVNAKKFKH